MILGFTGTVDGMTDIQKEVFIETLLVLKPIEFHHGVCIGADADAHWLVRQLTDAVIVGHPGVTKQGRVWRRDDTAEADCDFLCSPELFLVRNRIIAKTLDVLVSTPSSDVEELRSGTWATVRYTRAVAKPIYLIYPYGKLVKE